MGGRAVEGELLEQIGQRTASVVLKVTEARKNLGRG
jgi:hypothetical protein